MKKIISAILILCLLFIQSAFAETEQFIIQPQYEMAGAFHDGLAAVGVNEIYGFINEAGELKIPPIYDLVNDFHNGLCIVERDGKYGIINTSGEEVVPLIYDSMDTYFEKGEPIYAQKDDKYGFINERGETVIPFEYQNVDMMGFVDGLCAVSMGQKHGYIDEKGKLVIPFQFFFAGMIKEGTGPVHDGEKWGLTDKEGNVPLGFVFDEIGWSKSGGVIAVRQNEKWALTDGKEMLTDFSYDGFGMWAEEDCIAALKDGKWGGLNAKGETVLPFVYDGLSEFSEGIVLAVKDEKVGYIDHNGNTVIPFLYEDGGSFSGGTCTVKKDGKWGTVDKQGKQVIPFQYDWISGENARLKSAFLNGSYGYIWNPIYDKDKPTENPVNQQVEAMLPSNWARTEVREAIRNGLVPKDLRSQFESPVTREEFCRLAVSFVEVKSGENIDQLLEQKGLMMPDGVFHDTNEKAVLGAYALGIVKGIGENLFLPKQGITREEAAAMLVRTAAVFDFSEFKGEKISFADEWNYSSWAAGPIDKVTRMTDSEGNNPVMKGAENNCFLPKDSYTREQAFVTFQRLFNVLDKE